MRGLDRPSAASAAPVHAPAPRGALAAVAAMAALLLSIAALASIPGAGLAALASQRVAVLADIRGTAAPAADHPTPSGAVPAGDLAPDRCPRAALVIRAGVMLRHTSLPPPARA